MRRVDLIGVCAVLVAATLWIDLSSIHGFTNADSLMMSLVSLYKWTPMFWEQNRLGMLVPALAMPFQHPLTNMLVQGGLTTLSALGSFFLLGYYIAGRRRGMTIGVLAALLFVSTQHGWQRFCYFIYIYQFHLSLSLALLGLLALQHWHRRGGMWQPPAALICLWLALWVNPSLVFAVGPLVLLRRFLLGDAAEQFDQLDAVAVAPSANPGSVASSCDGIAADSRCLPPSQPQRHLFGWPVADWIALFATASGLLVSMAISKFATDSQEQYAFLPPGEWLACCAGVLRDLTSQLDKQWFAAVTLVAATGLATFYWPTGRQAARVSGGIVLGLLIPAAVQLAFITSLDHVHRTNFGHYAFAAAFLWQGAFVAFGVLQWGAVLPDRPAARRVPWVLLAIFMVVVAARHGRPGVGVVRASLQKSIGQYTPEVLESGATHVTGDFWHVWPTMFYANMVLADRHESRMVWGLAFRCQPTADGWTQVPLAETRIAEIIGDEQHTASTFASYGLPPLVVEREMQTIRVLRPTVALSESLPVRRR